LRPLRLASLDHDPAMIRRSASNQQLAFRIEGDRAVPVQMTVSCLVSFP
jgi:hypothetical protein